MQFPSSPIQPLLDIRGLKTWYPVKKGVFARTVGYVRAVDGVDLTLARGETAGVVGESGCGKSTLARSILRLERPREGTIHVDRVNVLRARGARSMPTAAPCRWSSKTPTPR